MKQRNWILIIGVLLVILTAAGCGRNKLTDQSAEKTNENVNWILELRFSVNLGMEADLIVESLGSEEVTYRYFDYQHKDQPEKEKTTVPFSELVRKESGIKVYVPHVYLVSESEEKEVNMSEDFIKALENEPEFRKILGEFLGKPFPINEDANNVIITKKDILSKM